MSNHDICVSMLNDFTETQLANVAAMLRTMKQTIADAIYSETPNAETIAALMEGDEMLRTGSGQRFRGSAEELFAMLDAEDAADA
ncbi:hypothetical protein AALA82_01425 [Oscillospiraceae bacterium 50-16]